jgi:hypothetical protein
MFLLTTRPHISCLKIELKFHYLDPECYLATYMQTTIYFDMHDGLYQESVLFMCLVLFRTIMKCNRPPITGLKLTLTELHSFGLQ